MNVRIGSRPGTLVSVVLTMALAALAAVPAAGTDDRETDAASEFWMPNPAAFYVSELGYEYEIVRSPDGERGLCVLPDGRHVRRRPVR